MSKAYDLIVASLNEIITDLKDHGGKNLRRERLSITIEENSSPPKSKTQNVFPFPDKISYKKYKATSK